MAGIPDGFAPGFYNLADVMDRRVQDLNADVVNTAIALTNQIHTQTLNEMFRLSVEPVTWFKRRVRVGGSRQPQILTENAAPKPQRAGLHFDIELPLQIAADSIADNIWSRGKTTVQDINDEMMMIMDGFTNWHFRQFLTATFNNTSWSYTDDSDDIGTLTIQPLANNDAFKYPTRSGSPASAQANHYVYQGVAIANDADPYKTLHDLLKSHPTNSGPYVVQIASNLRDTTEDLAAFVDTDQSFVIYGDDTTRAAPEVEQYMGWGNEVIGIHKETGVILVEADRLPDGMLVMQATGTDRRPVAMREEPEAELRGYIMEENQINSNVKQTDIYRRTGMGVQNRIAMAVALVDDGSAGSYTVPDGYTAPAK